MDQQSQPIPAYRGASLPLDSTDASRLAARTALALSSADASLEALLEIERPAGSNEDWVHAERRLARTELLLALAEKLLIAIDADSIFPIVLETVFRQLGFNVCQYAALESDDEYDEIAANLRGEILYEIKDFGAQSNRVHSYSHAGLEGKRRCVRGYAELLGELRSANGFRSHVSFDISTRSKRFPAGSGGIFGVRGVKNALIIPVIDVASGEIRGTLHFLSAGADTLTPERLEMALAMAKLASKAFSRACVLEKALAMASSDELTGLMNRRGYYQRFEAEVERARRHQTPLCVALLDVDHFKKFNDTYGHLSGDLILKTLSDLFVKNMRKSDVICRFGGEEFAILLPDTSIRAAADLIDRLRQSVENLTIPDFTGAMLKVTVSAGLAQVNTRPAAGPHDSEMAEALALADEQLYLAKNTGRNHVRYADSRNKPVPSVS